MVGHARTIASRLKTTPVSDVLLLGWGVKVYLFVVKELNLLYREVTNFQCCLRQKSAGRKFLVSL